MSKSLFLLKRREDFDTDPSYSSPTYSESTGTYTTSYHIATGMWNSAKFVIDMLNANGREADIGLLIDGNSIDAAVYSYNPTHVFIEGLWVTPEKMAELMALPHHAGRKWIVRIHSEIPFIASEGIAMQWIAEYVKLGVYVAANATRATEQLTWEATNIVSPAPSKILYLPNCYPVEDFEPIVERDSTKEFVDVACFGAFRPLKNHLQQAFIALRFAQKIGKPLRFHINHRQDSGGEGAARNVLGLFSKLDASTAQVVEHDWEDRETFLESMRHIDILMQLSISETFNIVAADAVLIGKPIIASNEIPWIYPLTGDPQNVDDCIQKMTAIYSIGNFFITKNRLGLIRYNQTAKLKWLSLLSAS